MNNAYRIGAVNVHGVALIERIGAAEIACNSCHRQVIVDAADVGIPGVMLNGKIMLPTVKQYASIRCLCGALCEIRFTDSQQRKGGIIRCNDLGPLATHLLNYSE